MTKEGSLAGPKTLEHLVDAVLSVEGDRSACPAPRAGHEELLRVDGRGRRAGDGRNRASRGSGPGPGLSGRPRCRRSRECRGRHARGFARAAGRGPGARGLDHVRDAASDRDRSRPGSAGAPRCRPGTTCRDRARAATTCMPAWQADWQPTIRPWTWRSRSRWPRRSGTVRWPRARSRSERSVCSVSCGP